MDDLEQAKARVGTVVKGKWRLDALLGCGGMAAVYRATHRNGNEVAVKMLHPHLSVSRAVRERFLREGYVANKVRHKNAVTVQDDDVSDDGAAFLVMELLEGETLEQRRLRLGGKIAGEEVLKLTDQLLSVLVKAHQQGIVHRDLKPDNVFLTHEGDVKVLDFGIARIRELSSISTATQTGSLLGTPAYMAPEQARGRWNEVDHQTDIWAVGATMHTLLAGIAVHEAETASETLALAVTTPARPLRAVAPQVDPRIGAVVDKALRYEKSERWASAEEMRLAIRDAMTASAIADYAEISQISQVSNVSPAVTAPVGIGGQSTLTPGGMELSMRPPAADTTGTGLRAIERSPKAVLAIIAAAVSAIAFALLVVVVVAIKNSGATSETTTPASAASEVVGTAPSAASAPPASTAPSASGNVDSPPAASASASPSAATKTAPVQGTRPYRRSRTRTPKTETAQPDPWDIRTKEK